MKKHIILGLIFGGLFFGLMFILTTVDVQSVGPLDNYIGLATINIAVRDFIGSSELCYKFSEIFGLSEILVAGIFGLLGLSQWIKRKNMFKVDYEILATGVLYLLAIIIYIIFSKYSINYRPILMEGELSPEPSFPSSHTLLVVVTLGSAIILTDKYIKAKKTRKLIKMLATLLLALTIMTRFLAGIHWLTDIIGGILLALCLLQFYLAALVKIGQQQ